MAPIEDLAAMTARSIARRKSRQNRYNQGNTNQLAWKKIHKSDEATQNPQGIRICVNY
jgi:hypothetical protein